MTTFQKAFKWFTNCYLLYTIFFCIFNAGDAMYYLVNSQPDVAWGALAKAASNICNAFLVYLIRREVISYREGQVPSTGYMSIPVPIWVTWLVLSFIGIMNSYNNLGVGEPLSLLFILLTILNLCFTMIWNKNSLQMHRKAKDADWEEKKKRTPFYSDNQLEITGYEEPTYAEGSYFADEKEYHKKGR